MSKKREGGRGWVYIKWNQRNPGGSWHEVRRKGFYSEAPHVEGRGWMFTITDCWGVTYLGCEDRQLQ